MARQLTLAQIPSASKARARRKGGVGRPEAKQARYGVKIPLPSLEIQKHLVAGMEEQEKIIEANKKLIGIMEQKITEVLSEI